MAHNNQSVVFEIFDPNRKPKNPRMATPFWKNFVARQLRTKAYLQEGIIRERLNVIGPEQSIFNIN